VQQIAARVNGPRAGPPIELLEWVQESDLCVAELGAPLRWGTVDPVSGRVDQWTTGRTVAFIGDGSPVRVYLVDSEEPDGWPNPIYCPDEAVRTQRRREQL
jgi:hypothetical protein